MAHSPHEHSTQENKKDLRPHWLQKITKWLPSFPSNILKIFLINFTLSCIVWGAFIFALPYLGPQIEQLLFPSSRYIKDLRVDIKDLQKLIPSIQNEIKDITQERKNSFASTKDEMAFLKENIKKLEEKLNEFEKNNNNEEKTSPKYKGEIILLSPLKEKALNGLSFYNELLTLKNIIKDDSELVKKLEALETFSKEKTPTEAELKLELEKIAYNTKPIIHDEKSSSKSFLEQLTQNLKNLVTFEEASKSDSDTEKEKTYALKALENLKNIDFQGALNHLKSSQMPIFTTWIENCTKRLSLNALIQDISNYILAHYTN